MSNTALWDSLGKTDPAHTKRFSRSGGFKGTATKPMWVYRRLTEQFGPVGIGWGHSKPDYQVVPGAEGEVLVYCTVECWHSDRANTFHGVGGDKVVSKNKHGLFSDDEAYKKAFTDAVMNAFKSLGVAADVHMGLFDDDKYIAQMEREFSMSEPPELVNEGHIKAIRETMRKADLAEAKLLANLNCSQIEEMTLAQYELAIRKMNEAIKQSEQKEAA